MQGGNGRARGNRRSGAVGPTSGRGARLRVRGGSERAFAEEADAEGEPTPGADVEAELRMLEEEEQMLINEIDELREAIGRNRNKQKEVNK